MRRSSLPDPSPPLEPGEYPPRTMARLRWGLLFGILATTVLVVFFLLELRQMVSEYEAVPGSFGRDFAIYLERVQSWFDGNGLYLDRQLHGPYTVAVGDAL